MKPHASLPVVVLKCRLTGLSIMRSLGNWGVPVWGVCDSRWSPGLTSRYCRKGIVKNFEESDPRDYLECLLDIGRQLGRGVLIPTSDELSLFVAEHARELEEHFVFQRNSSELVRSLASKEEMYRLALKHKIPTPETLFPRSLEDVQAFARTCTFPVVLKGIFGNLLHARTGIKMVIVSSVAELIEKYLALEDFRVPNLMIQEYIPGGDDQVYIFNGYFDGESECLAAFTGHMIRQFPVHFGVTSLGVCKRNEKVKRQTIRFMKEIGYKGILDIEYRLDPRDGRYKVLDINPRIGQAFRLFVAKNDMDVAKALYLDLTGQEMLPAVPREGRRWVIENEDMLSSVHYFREGTLGVKEWLGSFRGVEELAWFNRRDLVPFLMMVPRSIVKFCAGLSDPGGRRETRPRRDWRAVVRENGTEAG